MKHIFSLEELKEVLDVRAYTMLNMFWYGFFTEVYAENGVITLSAGGNFENSVYDFVMNETLISFIEVEGLEIKGSMENIEISLNNLYYDLVAHYVRSCLSYSFVDDYTVIDLHDKCNIHNIEELDSVLYYHFDNCYQISQSVDFSEFNDWDEYFVCEDYRKCTSFDFDTKIEMFNDYIYENIHEVMNALSDSDSLESISEEDVERYLEESKVSASTIAMLLEML